MHFFKISLNNRVQAVKCNRSSYPSRALPINNPYAAGRNKKGKQHRHSHTTAQLFMHIHEMSQAQTSYSSMQKVRLTKRKPLLFYIVTHIHDTLV